MNSPDAGIGMQLARQGRLGDALPFLERAHRDAPNDLALLHALGNILQSIGRATDAVDRYRKAAALMPENAEAAMGLTRALLLAGDDPQAIAELERSLGLDPKLEDPGGMLDMVLTELNDPDTSCALLGPLVERHPERANLVLQYAYALTASERMDESAKAYEQYAVLRPAEALPHVELSRLAVNRGDRAGARAHLDAALAIEPDNSAALWEVSQVGGGNLDAPTFERVRDLASRETDPRRLAPLHDVLARHYDRAGDYGLAAMHAQRVNAIQTGLTLPQNFYDPRLRERETDITIAIFDKAFVERMTGAGNPDRRPVFVIGMPRSGTTLLQQMLTSHPDVISVGEQVLADASFRRALASAGSITIDRMPRELVREAADWHLQRLEDRVRRLALRDDAARVIDKLPDNYMFAGWLSLAFPNAAIVHCLRDPCDVALSCWRTQFSKINWALDLDFIVHRIEQHRRLMRHWRSTIGHRLTEIRFERLIAEPEAVLRRVVAAVGLEWHPDVLAFAERKGYVRSASQYQVGEPLNARGIGHWRNYEETLRPVMPRLEAIVARDAREATDALKL
jgi:tetratricopeptide (TPR) repeat protein